MAVRSACLALLILAAPSAWAEDRQVCNTNGSSLSVRSSPSIHGRRTASVPSDEALDIVGESANGGWLRVSLGNRRFGWVSKMHVCEPGSEVALATVVNPVPGACRSSSHGFRTDPFHGDRTLHDGVDLAAPNGSAMFAAYGGTVVHAGPLRGYGYAVVVRQDNPDGSVSMQLYGHMCCGRKTRLAASSIVVAVGDVIAAGAPIGQLGSTGRSTGPHLHLNMRRVPANGRQTFLDPTHDDFFEARYSVNPEDHLHVRSCNTPNAAVGGHEHDAGCNHKTGESSGAFFRP